MVIHNPEQEQKWMQTPPPQSKKKQRIQQPRWLPVLAVQCSACIVIVLVVLLFRVAGGTAYTKLQQGFADAMARNELMAVVMRWWDGDPAEIAASDDVKDNDFTLSEAGYIRA